MTGLRVMSGRVMVGRAFEARGLRSKKANLFVSKQELCLSTQSYPPPSRSIVSFRVLPLRFYKIFADC